MRDWPAADQAALVPAAVTRRSDVVYRDDFIQPEIPRKMVHVSSVTPLADGGVAAVWYSGSREGAADVAIYYSSYDSDGWQPARLLVDRHSASCETGLLVTKVGNAVVFCDASGRLWLFFASCAGGGWSTTSLNYKVSADRGATWSAAKRLVLSPFFNLTWNVKNKAAFLEDGSFLLPVYQEFLVKRSAVLHVKPSPSGVACRLQRITFAEAAVQPSLIPLGGGEMLAMFRNMRSRRVLAAASADNGRRWSDLQPLAIDNPNAGIDAVPLGPRTVLAVVNDHPTKRFTLAMTLSEDGGANWRRVCELDREQDAEFSYPSLCVEDGGLIHLTYTYKRRQIKHVVFSEAWLKERLCSSPGGVPLRR